MKAEHRDIIDRAKLHGLYPSTIAHELLVRDLVDTMITELRNQRVPFHLLKQDEQQEVIERATERAKEATEVAIQIISARGAVAVAVDMKSIKVEAKTMTITAKVDGAEPNKHELTDAAGKLCLLVMAPNDYEDALDDIAPDRDQHALPLHAGGIAESVVGTGSGDPLYLDAVSHVQETRRASISAVQRHLKIGYNRATRIIEAMEADGIVTTPNTNGEREVIGDHEPLQVTGELPIVTQDGQGDQLAGDTLAGAGELGAPTFGGHTIDDITILVLRRDNIDINWLQSRFALSTDEAARVTLLLLEQNVIVLDAEGEKPDLNTYRVTVGKSVPAEEPMNLE